jgi:hypothetical protein
VAIVVVGDGGGNGGGGGGGGGKAVDTYGAVMCPCCSHLKDTLSGGCRDRNYK